MFDANEVLIQSFGQELRSGYRRIYGSLKSEYEEIICWVSRMSLENIANSDALYHNVEHTIQVTLVGQEILLGKHVRDGGVKPEDWLHFVISLLCHDIGYVRGVCRADRKAYNIVATGKDDEVVKLPQGSSDASLSPYHVDRGKLFIKERFGDHDLINYELISENIELTRFPIPEQSDHQATLTYPGLVRAADLVGQMSDPRYLNKTTALFHEFEETGTNKKLGFKDPSELRDYYPQFFWRNIHSYVKDGLVYLDLSKNGKQIIAHLNSNIFVVEHDILSKRYCEP